MLGVGSVARAGGKQETETGAASKEKEGKIGISRNFFFQTVRRDGADIIQDQPLTSNALPLPPGARSLRLLALAFQHIIANLLLLTVLLCFASTGQVPKRSTTGAAFTTKRKSSGGVGQDLQFFPLTCRHVGIPQTLFEHILINSFSTVVKTHIGSASDDIHCLSSFAGGGAGLKRQKSSLLAALTD
jgi:hypothetical protein